MAHGMRPAPYFVLLVENVERCHRICLIVPDCWLHRNILEIAMHKSMHCALDGMRRSVCMLPTCS